MFEEATEKIGFWILGGVGTLMVILGWTMSKQMGWERLPIWQMILIIAIVWGASLFFSARD